MMLIVLASSIYQLRQMEEEAARVAPVTAPPEKIEEAPVPIKPQPRELVPANPADYGMVVQEPGVTLTQGQWDGVISDKIEELRAQYSPQEWEKIDASIKEDPAKTKEKLQKIEEKMRAYEEELKRNPASEEIQGRLERLKMLKSIAKGLAE